MIIPSKVDSRRQHLLRLAMMLALGACDRVTGPPTAEHDFESDASYVAEGALHRITREGVQTSVLRSDSLYAFEVHGRYDLVGVELTFNNEQGAELGRLTALTGERHIAGNTFVARGDVVLVGRAADGSPWRLETDELHYAVSEDRIWTDRPFTLRESGRITHGSGFHTDSRLSSWEVIGGWTR